jgi:hypothetical protein
MLHPAFLEVLIFLLRTHRVNIGAIHIACRPFQAMMDRIGKPF